MYPVILTVRVCPLAFWVKQHYCRMRVHGKEVKKNDIRCKRKSTILIIANNYSALHHLTGHLMRGRQSTRPFFYYNVFFEIFNPSNPTHYFLAVLSANSESTRRNTGVISSFDISLPSLILSLSLIHISEPTRPY
mgnify:CR=1 FL=1